MKTTDYILLIFCVALIVTGFVLGGFLGGYIAGFLTAVALFVTVGRVLARKAQQRMDASMELQRKIFQSKATGAQ